MIGLGGLEIVDARECLRLLGTVPIGRVVFTDHALPAVRPVSFLLRDGMIVLRAGDDGRLTAALRDAVVAFEADEFDPETQAGWSVTAIGRARLVGDGGELPALGLPPRTPGQHQDFIVISTEIVTGHRVSRPQDWVPSQSWRRGRGRRLVSSALDAGAPQ